jgi:hypothetical protein
MKLFLAISSLLLISFSTTIAQGLVTDRPDFTESALVVSAKTIQIESGVEYEDFNSVTGFTYPGILARIGVGYNLEARLGFGGWTNLKINDVSNTYLNDLLFEAKYQLTSSEAEIPMALLFVATLPTGDDEVSVPSAEYGFKFATSYDINDALGLGFNIGIISTDIGTERELLSLASIALGIGLTNQISTFVEVFAAMPPNASWQPVVDGGFTFLVSNDAQLDFYVGKGLNDYGADLIVGSGFSYRFGL